MLFSLGHSRMYILKCQNLHTSMLNYANKYTLVILSEICFTTWWIFYLLNVQYQQWVNNTQALHTQNWELNCHQHSLCRSLLGSGSNTILALGRSIKCFTCNHDSWIGIGKVRGMHFLDQQLMLLCVWLFMCGTKNKFWRIFCIAVFFLTVVEVHIQHILLSAWSLYLICEYNSWQILVSAMSDVDYCRPGGLLGENQNCSKTPPYIANVMISKHSHNKNLRVTYYLQFFAVLRFELWASENPRSDWT